MNSDQSVNAKMVRVFADPYREVVRSESRRRESGPGLSLETALENDRALGAGGKEGVRPMHHVGAAVKCRCACSSRRQQRHCDCDSDKLGTICIHDSLLSFGFYSLDGQERVFIQFNLEMLHETEIESISFGAILGFEFAVVVEEQVRMRAETPHGTGSDGIDLFFAVGNAIAVGLAVLDLPEEVSVQADSELGNDFIRCGHVAVHGLTGLCVPDGGVGDVGPVIFVVPQIMQSP